MSTGWSPFLSSSLSDPEENDYYLTRELEMLERAVQDKGELRRRELGQLVGCKYWGTRPLRPGAPRGGQAGTPEPPAARLLRARGLAASSHPDARWRFLRQPTAARPDRRFASHCKLCLRAGVRRARLGRDGNPEAPVTRGTRSRHARSTRTCTRTSEGGPSESQQPDRSRLSTAIGFSPAAAIGSPQLADMFSPRWWPSVLPSAPSSRSRARRARRSGDGALRAVR